MSGSDRDFITGGTYLAADATGFQQESDNAIVASGQTLNASNKNQTAISHAISGAKGDFYQEAGGSAADAYVLEGSDLQKQIHQYKDGMRIRFRVAAGHTNTGASTVKVDTLGVKNIKDGAADPAAGFILAGEIVTLIFDESANDFQLKTDVLARKVIPIGDWNMDTTATLNVAHGLSDITKIRTLDVIIIRDDSNVVKQLFYSDDGSTTEGWISGISTTNVLLGRLAGGVFDGADYNATSFNRGFVTILYQDS